MAGWFLDQRIEEGRGGRTAILDDQGSATYAEIHALANRVAASLWARGVRPEDRVLIGLSDGREFAAVFFGVLKAGAVVTMVNPELPEADYDHYIGYTRCRALIADAALITRIAPTLRAHAAICHTVISVGGSAEGAVTWEDGVLPADAAFPTYDTSRDDPSVWLFTSGSTGKPKAAVHLHHDFPFNTECYAKGVLGFHEDDLAIGVPKLFFGYATGTNLLFPFAVGAAAVLFSDRSSPERLFELCARHRPTVLTSVPTMINKMLQCSEGRDRRAELASLRVCISAGEALPEELYRRWKATFGVEILDGIGSAELFHIYISNRFGEVRPGSLGRLVPGYQARVVGDNGQDLPDGAIGTLWVKGDSAALCYWQAHEKSKEVLRGDWVVSGDLFRRDGDGFFHYAGRADDLLKVGGIFVAPTEVEGCLMRHPGVLEAAVVGEEDAEGLCKPLAFVVPRPPATAGDELAAALIEHVRRELAHYKAPRRVEFVAELPRSDRGKILRRALRS
ncbi:MAG: benzoate-CoA ligase family protein [Myxococcales bacterium]|nr:benzoate-CoA ligase family protein [Myxococcales bacterium]